MANQATTGVCRTVGLRITAASNKFKHVNIANCFYGANTNVVSIGQSVGDVNLNANITNSQTSLLLQAGQGVRLPTSSGNPSFQPFVLQINSTNEKVLVTAAVGDTLTVTRGYDGTTAQSASAAAAVFYVQGGYATIYNLENIWLACEWYNNWGMGFTMTADSQVIGGLCGSNGYDPTGNTTSGNTPYTPPNGTNGCGLYVSSGPYEVTGTHFYGSWTQVYTFYSDLGMFTGCRFEACPNQAMMFTGNSRDNVITGCTFTSNGSTSGSSGSPVPNGSYNATLVPAIEFSPGGGAVATGNKVSDCRFSGANPGASNTQVWLYGVKEDTGSDYNLFTNNHMTAGVATGFALVGAHSITRGNTGWNPLTVTAPAFPLTTATYTNATGVDIHAYVTNGAATMSTVINGNTGPTLAASATVPVFIPAAGTFTPTYASGSPSWHFQGN
jgi:hypothetical protein